MVADIVFKAMADPARRRLLDVLHERAGLSLGELCAFLDMRRQSVSQHLDVLEQANLVTSVRDGRRKLHYLNPVPIHELQTRWIWKFEEPRLAAWGALKEHVGANTMNHPDRAKKAPDYVYTTYIHATAEEVWHALTDPGRTAMFWGHAQVSDWRTGSRVEHVRPDGSDIADAVGTVLEVDAPHHLSFSIGSPDQSGDPTAEHSVVTFDIESHKGITRLTITQTSFQSAQDRNAISRGWPAVLANLKTLMETGSVLPTPPWDMPADADGQAAAMTPLRRHGAD